MHHFFRQTLRMDCRAPSRMVLLCLLVVIGTSRCTDTVERPVEEPDSSATLRDQQTDAASDVSEEENIAPIRILRDPYAMFAGVAVDPVNDKAILSDDNTRSLMTYDLTVPGDSTRMTEYRQKLAGPRSGISNVCGITVDPVTKEIYMVNTDVSDNVLVFSYEQAGDVPPVRELRVDHGSWGITLDRDHDELFMTVQHLNKIAVYPSTAQGTAPTFRVIQGPNTQLVDPH